MSMCTTILLIILVTSVLACRYMVVRVVYYDADHHGTYYIKCSCRYTGPHRVHHGSCDVHTLLHQQLSAVLMSYMVVQPVLHVV